MSGFSYIKTKCIVCGLPKNDRFYDKSEHRPLCAKSCYSGYIDNLPARYVKQGERAAYGTCSKTAYRFPIQGRLTKTDFDLNNGILARIF